MCLSIVSVSRLYRSRNGKKKNVYALFKYNTMSRQSTDDMLSEPLSNDESGREAFMRDMERGGYGRETCQASKRLNEVIRKLEQEHFPQGTGRRKQ